MAEQFNFDVDYNSSYGISESQEITTQETDKNDGFSALWEVTEQELISPEQTAPSTLEELVSEQKQEIFLLKDEIELLKEENHSLRKNLLDTAELQEQCSQLSQDYQSVLSLNKSLTKKLNQMMSLYENELQKIAEIKNIIL